MEQNKKKKKLITLVKTRSNMIKLKQNGTKLNIITNIKIVQDVQIV